MKRQEAEAEMYRLNQSSELQPYRHTKWVGNLGLAVLRDGGIGIFPNPYLGLELPPETDFRVIYQDHDAGRTEDISGWTAVQVLELIKSRAEAAGNPL